MTFENHSLLHILRLSSGISQSVATINFGNGGGVIASDADGVGYRSGVNDNSVIVRKRARGQDDSLSSEFPGLFLFLKNQIGGAL